jgi:hypothetical protein
MDEGGKLNPMQRGRSSSTAEAARQTAAFPGGRERSGSWSTAMVVSVDQEARPARGGMRSASGTAGAVGVGDVGDGGAEEQAAEPMPSRMTKRVEVSA